MPQMIKLNRVMQVSDGEVEHYRANGYKIYEPEQRVESNYPPYSEPEKPKRGKAAAQGEPDGSN